MKTVFCYVVLVVVLSVYAKAQISGNALRYDGVNDYVYIGDAPIFSVGAAVTYEAWINPDTAHAGFIFNKWSFGAEDKQLMINAAGRLQFYLFNVFNLAHLPSSSIISVDQYTHIAATYDALNGIAKLFINGVFDTSKTVGSGVSNSSAQLYFGSNPDRGGLMLPFKGIIDEVRIWNIARTEAEIQSTMNQILNGNEPGLVGYWKFDEGTGTTTSDATSNSNHGTISGATWVIVSDVEQTNGSMPETFLVAQNYPNPFNPNTNIRYTLPHESHVRLTIYTILGQEVVTLLDEQQVAGHHAVRWEGNNSSGVRVGSGVYFYRLEARAEASAFTSVKKMVLMK